MPRRLGRLACSAQNQRHAASAQSAGSFVRYEGGYCSTCLQNAMAQPAVDRAFNDSQTRRTRRSRRPVELMIMTGCLATTDVLNLKSRPGIDPELKQVYLGPNWEDLLHTRPNSDQ